MDAYEGLYDAVLSGNAETASSITEAALAAGADPEALLNTWLIPAMGEAGKRFEAGEYFIPELLITARAMKAAMAHIRPKLAACGAEPVGRVVIGTIAGDQHDIGKNLAASMLEGGGFEVIDLGYDVQPAAFVEAVREKGAQVVGMSALLTTTMPGMKRVVEELEKAGLRDKVKVLIGGAPITDRFAREIGADAYAPTANAGVDLARKCLGV